MFKYFAVAENIFLCIVVSFGATVYSISFLVKNDVCKRLFFSAFLYI